MKQIALGLKDAYHGLCIGCHEKISGPVECGRCHIKKKNLDIIYVNALSRTYQPVMFSHGYHIGLAKKCPPCHHYGEAGSSPPCRSYHEETGLGLKAAYHGLCVGYHEKGKGPTACSACHGEKADKR